MKKYLGTAVVGTICLTLSILGLVFNSPIELSCVQTKTIIILGIVCGCSALLCFTIGELTKNNSQMDKVWSILPIVYCWIIAGMGEMKPRLVIFAIIVTLWGIRLTFNFARKGAYKLKFWQGEEDYRWQVLRQNKILGKKPIWAVFDLFFISGFQNGLVLMICLPSFAAMNSYESLNYIDIIATFFALFFLLYETIADEQQMAFHITKRQLLSTGLKLEELPSPFNKGFNTTGLWAYSRHPNYFGEQMIWISLYIFVIASKAVTYEVFSWTILGPAMLVILFLGSSAFQEGVSSSKYPEYKTYLEKVSKYIPFKKY